MARLALALVVLSTLSCGRVHTLAPGTFALSATGGADGCGIASRPGALWTMTLDTFGHVVKGSYAIFGGATGDLPVVGQFKEGTEAFYVDGTLSGPAGAPLQLTGPGGQPCEVELLSVHLEADVAPATSPLSATAFNGELVMKFDTPAPDACVCTSRLQFQAQQ